MNTFTKQPQIQRMALERAIKSPFIGKHGKRKTTLLKEEVYKQVQDNILSKVKILIETQMDLALGTKNGKPNSRIIDSLLDRAFGKPGPEVRSKNNSPEVGEETSKMANLALKAYLDQRRNF